MLDKIIFGDNQFFGVNHMSETKSQQQQERFSILENIIDTIDIAYSNGATGLMLHSHPRANDICALVNALPGVIHFWGWGYCAHWIVDTWYCTNT